MFRKSMCMAMFFLVIFLTACGSKEPIYIEGEEYIKAAMEEYRGLDSATMEISDEDTGTIISRFDFMYDGNTQIYMLKGSVENPEYIEYNDGKQLWISDGEKSETYGKISKYFKKYTRKNPNPNASTGIFFFQPDYIADAEVTVEDDFITVLYTYDNEALGNRINVNTETSSLDLYQTEYVFDPDGNFLELYQRSKITENGNALTSNYAVRITNKNSVSLDNNYITTAD